MEAVFDDLVQTAAYDWSRIKRIDSHKELGVVTPFKTQAKPRYMPFLTDEIEQLCEKYEGLQGTFRPSIKCNCCNELVPLRTITYNWHHDDCIILFPDIPAYQCTHCGKTDFPVAERREMARAVKRVVRQAGIETDNHQQRTRRFVRNRRSR